MLFLIATPIGNLGDLSRRAVETLQGCDYILCEDTRHSAPLLTHYGIVKPLKSYHKFKEASAEEGVIEDLKSGQMVGLICDAGTPGIADAGTRLVTRCHEEGLAVTAIPGPCSPILALTLSGCPTDRFQVLGFLEKKGDKRREQLLEALNYPGTTLCLESPHRIVETIEYLQELAPDRPVCVMRELTKLYEERIGGVAEKILSHFAHHPPRGEIVLVIPPCQKQPDVPIEAERLIELLQKEYQLSATDALKTAAALKGIPRRILYKKIHLV